MNGRTKLLLALAVTSIGACSKKKNDQAAIPTVEIGRRDIIVTAQATGTVEPEDTVPVKSQASGLVMKMPVEIGQVVKPGDLLVQIDTRTLNNDFQRLTYTEAIEILKESNHNKKKKFQYLVEGWGVDLQSEHERYLVEKHFKKPVILTNYPKDIKAFYMRQNDDGKTVAAMDILAPGIGEIVGGSQREERLDRLEQRMKEMHIPAEELSWYLDTRRFGTVPHAGFGLGFERMVLFVTGMTNIRDVIAFARTPKNCEF